MGSALVSDGAVHPLPTVRAAAGTLAVGHVAIGTSRPARTSPERPVRTSREKQTRTSPERPARTSQERV